MAHLVRLGSNHVELPYLSLKYPISPPLANLHEGLEAYQNLREDLSLQSLPLPKRREVTRFLQQLGMRLFETVFPEDSYRRLGPNGPILLEAAPELQACPWELLNDGGHWLALTRGVVRYVAPPAAPLHIPAGAPGPFRVFALSANPLPGHGDEHIAGHHSRLGTRFISSVDMLLDPPESTQPEYVFRAVEHATPFALEAGLNLAPGLAYFTGFTGREGWYLEGDGLRPERVNQEWLGRRLGEAAREGLKGLVLNDSMGMLEPVEAAQQTHAMLHNGLPALVRIQGRQARLREQDYMRALVGGLARGQPMAASHLAAVRRLNRRFEESWDWSFIQLYYRATPAESYRATPAESYRATPAESYRATPAESYRATPEDAGRATPEAGERSTAKDAERAVRAELPGIAPYAVRPQGAEGAKHNGFALMPPPPLFRRRRRVFGRRQELHKLAEALVPDENAGSPLVCLSGAPGSGKTALALEAVRRVHGHFVQVVYLHSRDLMPHQAGLARPSPLEPPPVEPGLEMFRNLARHLEVHEIAAEPPQQWCEALGAHLAMGPPRLIVVDGLEFHPGYYEFCRGLQEFPRGCRVLLISRGKPPLLPGPHLHLEPLDASDLGTVFNPSLLQRIAAHPMRESLLQVCGTDLLVARMMWRLQRWPMPTRLAPLLAPPPDPVDGPAHGAIEGAGAVDSSAVDTGAVLELVLQAVLAELSRDALNVLQALGMFTFLVRQEVLSHLTEMDSRRLGHALAELQWMGLVDAYDGDRYYGLHLRLQNQVAGGLVTPVAYQGLRPMLMRCYQSWLAGLRNDAHSGGSRLPGVGCSPLAWGEAPAAWGKTGGAQPASAHIRHCHRLGVERVNLAELALILAEEEDWQELTRLVAAASFLQDMPGMEDLAQLLNRLMLGAGMAMKDSNLQSAALVALAKPLLAQGRPAQAQPLLEHALRLLGADPSWEQLAETYLLLSSCYESLGRADAAVNMLHAAEELAGQLGHPGYLVEAVSALVRVWREQGEGEGQAQSILERTIQRLEHGGHYLHAATLRVLLGEVLSRAGRSVEAKELFQIALANIREAENPQRIYDPLLRVARAYLLEQLPDEALDAFMQARVGEASGKELARESEVLESICRMFEAHERHQEALNGYLLLRTIREELGGREGLLAVLDVIGGLYFQLGEKAKSTRFYQESLLLKEAIPQS